MEAYWDFSWHQVNRTLSILFYRKKDLAMEKRALKRLNFERSCVQDHVENCISIVWHSLWRPMSGYQKNKNLQKTRAQGFTAKSAFKRITRVLLSPCLLPGPTTFRVTIIYSRTDCQSWHTHAPVGRHRKMRRVVLNFIVMFFYLLTTSLVKYMMTGYDAKKYTHTFFVLLDYKSQ